MHVANIELLSAACCVVALDGVVTEREMKVIKAIAEKAGVSDFYLTSLLDQAKRNKDLYQEKFRIAHGDPVKTLRNLLIVAAVDGKVSKEELPVLYTFCDRLKVPRATFEELIVDLQKQVRSQQREKQTAPVGAIKPAKRAG